MTSTIELETKTVDSGQTKDLFVHHVSYANEHDACVLFNLKMSFARLTELFINSKSISSYNINRQIVIYSMNLVKPKAVFWGCRQNQTQTGQLNYRGKFRIRL